MTRLNFTIVLCFIAVSCKLNDRRAIKTLDPSDQFKSSADQIKNKEPKETKIYLSPFEAKATIDRELSLGDSRIVEGYQAPRLSINFNKSDFVQVLRCAASYRMQTLLGEDVRNVKGRPGERSALEWAWTMALADSRICKLVGTKVSTNEFVDLTSPKGTFYYIINPCILAENSVLKREECSYDLTLTYPITVTDSLSDETRTVTKELADAEAILNASLVAAKHLAKKINIHLTACENRIAHDKSLLDFKKGLIQLIFLAGGATIGGRFLPEMFRGPNGAVMLGQMAGTIGAAMFYTKVLKFPADIANECIDSSVVATTEAQRKEAAQYDKTNVASIKGKYEEEYQVQALMQNLQKLIGPQGQILKNVLRVREKLEDLYILESRVISINQAISQAANYGIDLNDISTFPGIPEL